MKINIFLNDIWVHEDTKEIREYLELNENETIDLNVWDGDL